MDGYQISEHISFLKGGKSYEELKEELGDVASPVNVTTVCKVSMSIQNKTTTANFYF